MLAVLVLLSLSLLSGNSTPREGAPERRTLEPKKSSWTVVRVRPAWCPARHKEAE
jgi:hypothetical protein